MRRDHPHVCVYVCPFASMYVCTLLVCCVASENCGFVKQLGNSFPIYAAKANVRATLTSIGRHRSAIFGEFRRVVIESHNFECCPMPSRPFFLLGPTASSQFKDVNCNMASFEHKGRRAFHNDRSWFKKLCVGFCKELERG